MDQRNYRLSSAAGSNPFDYAWATVNGLRVASVATVYAALSAVFVLRFNGRLIPDTFYYATAHPIGVRASPVMSAFGYVGGVSGVRFGAILFAGLLGAAMGAFTSWRWSLFVLVGPWAWAIGYAGADSAGAFMALIGMQFPILLPLAVIFHVQASLVAGISFWSSRVFRTKHMVSSLAICGGIFSIAAMWHMQIRYLLPSMVIVAWNYTSNRYNT